MYYTVLYYSRSSRTACVQGTTDKMMVEATTPEPIVHGTPYLGDAATAETRLSELRSDVAAILAEMPAKIKPKDTSAFYLNIEYKKAGGQQCSATCMFCRRVVVSTGSARLLEHLSTCSLVTPDAKKVITDVRDHQMSKRKAKATEGELIAKENDVQMQIVKQQKFEQKGIRASFGVAASEVADKAVANFFYANGLSFSAADSSQGSYYQQMIRAIQAAPSGWKPPNSNKISGPLLDSCWDDIQRTIQERDPNGRLAMKFGSSYTQDGWDAVDSTPLINSAYITANDGGVYLRSVDTSGLTKDAEYIAALCIEDIYAIGCWKVVAIVTDTCNTMQKAWQLVEDEFPWISCVPCQAHVTSLLAKDASKIQKVDAVLKSEGVVVNWFTNHQKPLAILRRVTREKLGKTCELVKAGATRFGTNTLVGERLLKLKSILQQTVVQDDYVKENYKDGADVVEASNCENVRRAQKGGTAKKLVLDDSGFWTDITDHVNATSPILSLLRRHDSSAPTVGKVYNGFFSLGEQMKDLTVEYKDDLIDKHASRWAYGHCNLFSAAYVLDPEFIDHDQLTNDEVMSGFYTVVEKIAVLTEVRRVHALEDDTSCAYQRCECAPQRLIN